MTPKQLRFIRTLVEERQPLPASERGLYVSGLVASTAHMDVDAGEAPDSPSGTQASAIIDWLMSDVPRTQATRVVADTVELEEGYYAVELGGVLRFFKVDRPTEGRWAGRQFLSEVIGGASRGRAIKEQGERQLVSQAIATDAAEAHARYGKEIGRCGYCRTKLTDDLSRASGVGPECARKHGVDRKALSSTNGNGSTHTDGCDECGSRAELYYNDATGLSLCDTCDMAHILP